MVGKAATVFAENVPKLGVVQQRPYLRVVGALEVVARLSRSSRLQQDLEVLFRVARDPRAVERVAEQRAPTARRRADEVGEPRHRPVPGQSPQSVHPSHVISPLIRLPLIITTFHL